MPKKKYSEDECIRAIQRAYTILGCVPTADKYKQLNLSPKYFTIIRRFGNWNNAIVNADLVPNTKGYTQLDCVVALQKCYHLTHTLPTIDLYKTQNIIPTAQTIINICGSWNNALALANLQK